MIADAKKKRPAATTTHSSPQPLQVAVAYAPVDSMEEFKSPFAAVLNVPQEAKAADTKIKSSDAVVQAATAASKARSKPEISVTGNFSIETISNGLYEKMISSFSGLVVGLIAYSAYHAINMMVDKFSINLQAVVMDFLDTLNEPAA